MKKTIKIIDLLVKVANDEEVPKIIRYNDETFEYQEYCKDYKCISDIEYGFLLKDDFGVNYCYERLNDEVEIIEEDKKIEKLELSRSDGNITIISEENAKIQNKINEIIDAINELKGKSE